VYSVIWQPYNLSWRRAIWLFLENQRREDPLIITLKNRKDIFIVTELGYLFRVIPFGAVTPGRYMGELVLMAAS